MNKKRILLWLNYHELTLGSVESLTGGMFASSAVDIPGASATFKGALVTYSIELKEQLVHVHPDTIETFGVVSSRTAMEMALGGQKQLGVDICISFTGNAGPSVQEQKPVGDVYIAIAFKDGAIVEHFSFTGGRNEIRKAAVLKGWEMLQRVTKEQKDNYL